MMPKRRIPGAAAGRRVTRAKPPDRRAPQRKSRSRKPASLKAARRAGPVDRPGNRRRELVRRTPKRKRPSRLTTPGRGVLLRIRSFEDLGCAAVCWRKTGKPATGVRGVGFGWPGAKPEDAPEALRTVKARGKGAAPGGPSSVTPGRLASRWAENDLVQAAEWAASLGHRIRLSILMALAAGPASYQQLCKTTGLTAGPLQHHVRTLRQAGMLKTPQRNTYGMTDRGRTCLGLLRAMSELGLL